MLTYKRSLSGEALVLQGSQEEISRGFEIVRGRFCGTGEWVTGAMVLRCSHRRQQAMARALERAGVARYGRKVI